MLKKLLTVVLPFALPFIVYFAYVAIARARAAAGKPDLGETPWPWLALTGVGLMAAVLIGVWAFSDAPKPGTVYIPDRYIDGELIPGEAVVPEDREEPDKPTPGVGMPAD